MNNWDRVRKFVSSETGISLENLALNSRIEQDLYVTGDDASELLENFVDHFKLDYRGFELSKYFGAEGFDPIGLGTLIQKLRGKQKAIEPTTALKLEDLVGWVDRGYWVEKGR